MSKDKLHIDKLFNQLKGKTYPIDPAGFDEIKYKLNDRVWSSKFKDYEHIDTPSFDVFPIAISDRSLGGKSAKSIVFFILALLFLGSGIWLCFNFFNKNQVGNIKTQKFAKNMTTGVSGQANEGFKKPKSETNTKPAINVKENVSEEISSNQSKEKTSRQVLSATAKNISNKVKTIAINDTLTYLDEYKTIGIKKLNLERHFNDPNNKIKKTVLNSFLVPNQQNIDSRSNKFSNYERLPEVDLINNFNLSSRTNLLNLVKNIEMVQEKVIANPIKPKIPFTPFIALGLGLQTAQNQFAHTQGSNGAAWEILLGLEKGSSNFYTGFKSSEYNFFTTQRRLNIYDSWPHKNANGDTIGWFKNNFRDTAFNSRDKSMIKIASIPLHYQFKVLQYKRFNLALGGGFNFNLYKQSQIYGRDNNNYSVFYPTTNSIIKRANITIGFNTRIGYRVTPFTALYLKIETFSGQNISKINTFDIKPNGANINIGLQRFIR